MSMEMEKGTSKEVPFSEYLARPARFERTTPAFGGQAYMTVKPLC